MALIRPLQREMGTVLIVGSKVLRMPVERRHALEHGLEGQHIQGESWHHDRAIMLSANEFHGCRIDAEFQELLLLMIPPSQRAYRTVGLHATRHALDQFGPPC